MQRSYKQLAFYEQFPSDLQVLLCCFLLLTGADQRPQTAAYKATGLSNRQLRRWDTRIRRRRSRDLSVAEVVHSSKSVVIDVIDVTPHTHTQKKTLLCRTKTPLIDHHGGLRGQEEMVLKIKGSGDVKVVSWVIRHRRLRLQAATSSRLGCLIYLLTDFMSRHFPRRLAAQAYASQVNVKGRGGGGGSGWCWGVHLPFMDLAVTSAPC